MTILKHNSFWPWHKLQYVVSGAVSNWFNILFLQEEFALFQDNWKEQVTLERKFWNARTHFLLFFMISFLSVCTWGSWGNISINRVSFVMDLLPTPDSGLFMAFPCLSCNFGLSEYSRCSRNHKRPNKKYKCLPGWDARWFCWWFRTRARKPPVGCIKAWEWWEKLPTDQLVFGSRISDQLSPSKPVRASRQTFPLQRCR